MADNTGVLPWWGERWHKAAFILFLICWSLYTWRGASALDWSMTLVILSGLLTSLVTLGRQLPLQNVLIVAVVFSGAGAFWARLVGTSLAWNDGLTWRTTIYWTIVLLNARAMGQYFLRSRRTKKFYGWELTAVAGGIFALCQAALYKSEIHIVIAPLAVIALLLVTLPFMLGKRAAEPVMNRQPIVVLVLVLLLACWNPPRI